MAQSLSHSKWLCKYHIVFTPKYRRKVIYYQLRADIQKKIKDLCKWEDIEIIEGHIMSDYIHLLLSIPPKYSVSTNYGISKRKKCNDDIRKACKFEVQIWKQTFLGRKILCKHSRIKYLNNTKYIREQEKEEQIMDKLKTKEYVDPFKGSK